MGFFQGLFSIFEDIGYFNYHNCRVMDQGMAHGAIDLEMPCTLLRRAVTNFSRVTSLGKRLAKPSIVESKQTATDISAEKVFPSNFISWNTLDELLHSCQMKQYNIYELTESCSVTQQEVNKQKAASVLYTRCSLNLNYTTRLSIIVVKH